ncbi:hypothetical protein [Gemmata obscuriglobus]|uniref:hypothetical protein n=1 Tax=Gemmata obscuriglobus TaxID=114 RepID=UPI0011CE17D1|nr:hypothetical protein [Gemmata obscuriglobus]
MLCPRDLARQVIAGGGHSPRPSEQLGRPATTVDPGHGRIEARTVRPPRPEPPTTGGPGGSKDAG